MGLYGTRTAAERNLAEGRRPGAARSSFPGWDIFPVFGGWEAVPKGTPVFRAVDLDGLVGKLRRRGTEDEQ